VNKYLDPPLRGLVLALGVTAAAATLAAPASADPADNSFLSALSQAGVGYNDPAATEQLGQSICPMLVEPGKSLASVYSTVSQNGISPDMAAFFTGIAISMYCPSAMSSIGNGTFLNNINGLNGLSGLGGFGGLAIPGL
jgi:hypothetical protein